MPNESLLLVLDFHLGRASGADQTSTEKVLQDNDAKQGAAKVTKNFFPHKILSQLKLNSLSQIKALDAAWRRQIEFVTIPFGTKTTVVPVALFDRVEEINAAKQAQRNELKERFIGQELPIIRETASVWMGRLFDKDDFPSAAEMQQTIRADVGYLPFPDRQQVKLAGLNQEALSRIQQNVDQQVSRAYEQGVRKVWEQLREPLQHMVTRLSEPKPKIFDSLTENLQQVVDLVPHLNLVGDADLNAFAQEIRTNLANWNPDNFRESATARRQAATEAAAVLERFGGLGRRKFSIAA